MTLLQNQSATNVGESAPLRAKSLWDSKVLLTIFFLVAALPAVGPMLLVHNYGVDVPYLDQWSLLGTTLESRQGGIPPSLFVQHNEHRIVVPCLIFIAVDNLTHWNQVASMRVSVVIACLTSLGVYCLLQQTIPPETAREAKIIGMWFVCNGLIFTMAQYDNWLAALGIENVLPMAFIVWALVVVRSSMGSWWRMGISIALATGATFSSGNGFLAWPLVGMIWAWSPSFKALKEKKWLLLAWCAGFAVNLGVYFHHYVSPLHVPGPVPLTAALLFQYVVVFMGGPLAVVIRVPEATVIGATLLIMLAIAIVVFVWGWWIKRDVAFCSNMIVWLAVAWFAVGSAMLAAPKRADLGVAQALSSRYSTFALWLVVGLLGASFVFATRRPVGKREVGRHLVTVLVSVVFVTQLLAIPEELGAAKYNHIFRLRTKGALLLIRSLPDDDPNLFSLLFPSVPYLRQMAETVDKIGFIHPPLIATNHAREIAMDVDPVRAPARYGHLDQAVQIDPQQLLATGWAILPSKGRSADAVFLTWDHFDNDPIIFAVGSVGVPHVDPDGKLGHGDYEFCGWNAFCPISRLPAGTGALRIRAWAFDVDSGRATPISGEGVVQR
jgi:hypothetical protein